MDLYDIYLSIKPQIDKRLAEFEKHWEKNKHQAVFSELVFCLCTPQTGAHKGWGAAWRIVEELRKKKKLTEHSVATILKFTGVRFHHVKAKRIVEASKLYYPHTKQWLTGFFQDYTWTIEVRDHLARTVKGLGMKEASHFLRNLGFGQDICILDRHILRNLVKYGVISEIPKLKPVAYREVEEKMKAFALQSNIPVEALDIVFWYNAKKEIFK